MKKALIALLKVKSIVTIVMTIAMVLMLTGVFNPSQEVFALFSTTYVAVITYFFTKQEKKADSVKEAE